MKTVFPSILLCLFLFSCSSPTASLSKEDKLRIATEVLQDEALLGEMNYLLLDSMTDAIEKVRRNGRSSPIGGVMVEDADTPTLQPGVSGKGVKWDTVKKHVAAHKPGNSTFETPVYVEFQVDTVEAVVNDALLPHHMNYLNKMGDPRAKSWSVSRTLTQKQAEKFLAEADTTWVVVCRAYFAQHHDHSAYRSVVFVPAFKLVADTGNTYTEEPTRQVFNVGAACPPACETGRPSSSTANDGALMARQAFPYTSPDPIPCLRYRAPSNACK